METCVKEEIYEWQENHVKFSDLNSPVTPESLSVICIHYSKEMEHNSGKETSLQKLQPCRKFTYIS